MIQFIGFTPSPPARGYFEDVVGRLQDEAPANSTIRATLSKVDGQYFGRIHIFSQAGEFVAVAESVKAWALGPILTSRMRRHLDHWKTNRFAHETVRGHVAKSGGKMRDNDFREGQSSADWAQ